MLAHILPDLVAFQKTGFCSRDKDDVVGLVLIDIQLIERRADNSAAAIALDCFADLFRGGYSDSKVIVFIFEYIGNESGRDARPAASVYTLKIPVTGNGSYFHQTTENVRSGSCRTSR